MAVRLQSLVLPLALAAGLTPAAEAARHRVGGPEAPSVPAEPAEAEPPALASYQVLTVRGLAAGEAVAGGPQADLPGELSDRLAEAVQEALGPGLEVRRGEPLGRADELVLTGIVQRARKGHRLARVFVGPLARARLVVDLELSEAGSGELIETGTVKKLWAMPGWSGALRGLTGLEKGVCREVVSYLAAAGAGSQPRPAGSGRPETARAAR